MGSDASSYVESESGRRSTLEEEPLLPRLKRYDPTAQDILRKQLFPGLLGVCRRSLLGDAMAEQIAWDVWTDFLCTHVHRVRHEAAIGSYLRITAIRRCRRYRMFRQRMEPVQDLHLSADPETAMIERLDQPEELRQLDACLSQLTEKSRRIVRLYYHEDLKQPEIGERFGFSKQYVGRVLKQALAFLRNCLEGK